MVNVGRIHFQITNERSTFPLVRFISYILFLFRRPRSYRSSWPFRIFSFSPPCSFASPAHTARPLHVKMLCRTTTDTNIVVYKNIFFLLVLVLPRTKGTLQMTFGLYSYFFHFLFFSFFLSYSITDFIIIIIIIFRRRFSLQKNNLIDMRFSLWNYNHFCSPPIFYTSVNFSRS